MKVWKFELWSIPLPVKPLTVVCVVRGSKVTSLFIFSDHLCTVNSKKFNVPAHLFKVRQYGYFLQQYLTMFLQKIIKII